MTIPLGEIQFDPNSAAANSQKTTAQPVVLTARTPMLSPFRHPEEWNRIRITGTPSPFVPPKGVTGFKREDKWDVKAGKGTTGATTTRVAGEPAKGSVLFRLYNDQHVDEWNAFVPLLKFDATSKTGRAVDIYHPALAAQLPPIVSVVVTSIGLVEFDDQCVGEVVVEFLEYLPAKATGTSTAAGSKGYSQGKGKDAAGQQADPAIVALQNQAKALAAQAQGTA